MYNMHACINLMQFYDYFIAVYVLFRSMKVTLKCNQDLNEPKFTAEGEPIEKEYVSYNHLHSFLP